MSKYDYSERRGCGCKITLVESHGELEGIRLEYCSEHAAAPALYKALQSAAKYYEMLERATGVEHPVLKEIRAALALVKKEGNNG